MDPKLHPFEISCYATIWVAGVFYSVYNVYLTGKLYSHDIASDDFTAGWSVFGRQKDYSDYEWKTWLVFLATLAPWICAHFLVAEVVRYVRLTLLPYWYLTVSLAFLLCHFGGRGTALVLLQPAFFFLLLRFNSRPVVWGASAALLAALNLDPTTDWVLLDEDRQYLLFVCFAWTHLRCLSFCLDFLARPGSEHGARELVALLGYSLYLPVLFLGPLILHSDFHTGLCRATERWTLARTSYFLLSLARFLGWLLVIEASLHFIYCNALQYQPQVVEQLGPWALCGLGYCMGQFFMTKYTVAYGLASSVARAELIAAPPHPKCIARIHLYSDMWRYFDRGLYAFLVRYIYVPSLGGSRKHLSRLLASSLCFAFVYVWHRTYLFVLIWTTLNFLGVTLEAAAKAFALTDAYQRCQKRYSAQAVRRFQAMIASPLFAMSCVSNFYFFGGTDIGNIFARKFTEDLYTNAVVLAFCYCGCQVSIEVRRWEHG